MGRLALHARGSAGRAAHGDALTRALSLSPDARKPARESRAPLCLLVVALVVTLAVLVPPPSSSFATRAQSGRNRSNQPAKTPPPRPRPAATPAPTPIPSPTADDPTTDDEKSADAQSAAGSSKQTTTTVVPASSSSPSSQRGAPEEAGEDDVVRITSNLVPLPAFVTDAQGRAVVDLQLKDFELLVDGQPRPIAEVSRAETPFTMVMLFDNSSSLRPAATRQFEKDAAAGFFKNVMRPIDRAAVVSVSSYPELSQPLTNDVRALVRTVEGFVKPEGSTALFDSIVYAADYLRLQRGRKVLVIVSDGTETSSVLDFDETLARALALNCQIYAVRTGHSDNPNLRDLAGERRLQEFAAQTGGAVYVPRDRAELRQAFAQIAADLAQQYVLNYYPSEDPPDGRFRKFTLRVAARPGLQVRTRKGYYARKG